MLEDHRGNIAPKVCTRFYSREIEALPMMSANRGITAQKRRAGMWPLPKESKRLIGREGSSGRQVGLSEKGHTHIQSVQGTHKPI